MSLAISNFEEQVWLRVFIPKWERIVQRILSRPKIKAVRKKKGATTTKQETAAAAASSPSVPVPRESTSSDGAARVLSDSASGSGSSSNVSPSSVWNTSTKGVFTKEGQTLLTRWFVDHITDPYPKDHEKHELARGARLSYDQISAWFINARVCKWVQWVRELQAGKMTQSASVAAASAVGPKPGAEGVEYKLKRIEVMKAEPRAEEIKEERQAAAAAASANDTKAKSRSKSKAGSSKGRNKKAAAAVETESDSECGSGISEETDEEDESMDAAAAAGPHRSTRERKAPAPKQAELEDSDDDGETMMKLEELPEQDDDDTQDDALPTALSSSSPAAVATVPAGQSSSFFKTHSPSLSASPAPPLSSSPPALTSSQFLDPFAQYVFSGSSLAPFNVLSLTQSQHAQLALPAMGGALSDSALAMSLSGSMPAMDPAAAGQGATVGAGVAAPSNAASSSPSSSMHHPLPLRTSDPMLMSVDSLTSIARLRYLQYQMMPSGFGLNMRGIGTRVPSYPPPPPPHLLQGSFNDALSLGALSALHHHSGGGMMHSHTRTSASSPTMGIGMGAMDAMRAAPAAAAASASLFHPSIYQQPPQIQAHSNPSATLLLGRVPAPFISGVPLAFTGAPASRPAAMSLSDSAAFSDSSLMVRGGGSGGSAIITSTTAASSSSSSAASTPAPSFGAFRFGSG